MSQKLARGAPSRAASAMLRALALCVLLLSEGVAAQATVTSESQPPVAGTGADAVHTAASWSGPAGLLVGSLLQ